MSEQLTELKNNFESKINIKVETNSKGFNTSVHVYQGASKEEIDKVIDNVIYAHKQTQKKLNELT